jgi:hypothetical protein
MSLKRYLDNGWLRRHQTSAEEVRQLIGIADRDIAQSGVEGLAAVWRLSIAYNATLQLSIAALAASGFQPERQNKHQRAIESLAFTIGLAPEEVAFVDHVRRKRHANVYEQADAVSDQEADELIAFARQLRERVVAWLAEKHPGWLPPGV